MPISSRTGHIRIGLSLLAVLVTLLAAACSSASKPAVTHTQSATTTNPKATPPSGSWPYPNADLANTRQAPGSVISSANVSQLQQAWTFRITSKPDGGVGTLAMSPVVVNGVVYIQDMQANVYALDLATGKLRWEYQVNTQELGGPGPDGVAVADGRVYGDTPHTAFALERGNRQAGLGRSESAQQWPGRVQYPAPGRRRPGLPGQFPRQRTGRRDPAGPRRRDRQADLEVQHDGRTRCRSAGGPGRLWRCLGVAAGRQ